MVRKDIEKFIGATITDIKLKDEKDLNTVVIVTDRGILIADGCYGEGINIYTKPRAKKTQKKR